VGAAIIFIYDLFGIPAPNMVVKIIPVIIKDKKYIFELTIDNNIKSSEIITFK
jgi:hypothetical protein